MKLVTPIRSQPLVNDIPGQLRLLAEQIDSGEVDASSVYAIIMDESRIPMIRIWGECPTRHELSGALLHCSVVTLESA